MKQLGIIIVTYNSERHIGPLLRSLAATIDSDETEICILDSGSTDATTAVIAREVEALQLDVRLIRSTENVGFATGNNLAYAELQAETSCEHIMLLNPDTTVHEGWWPPLLAELQQPGVGTAAPLLLLPDGTVNSRGNALHFLGIGYVQGYGESPDKVPKPPVLFSGSGAAIAFRSATLEAMNARMGTTLIFWEELFLYADDSDFGWRMRLMGLEPRLAPASRVTHDHQFWLKPLDGAGERMFWIERNRHLLLLANFKWPTIIVLLPWIVASELALALGLMNLYTHRARVWAAVWKEIRTPAFRVHRRGVQAGRTVPDRAILRAMTGSIRHGALPMHGFARVLDALLRWSHRFLCAIIWW